MTDGDCRGAWIGRREPGGAWALVEIAMELDARIADQERGKKLEYCVVAVNKAGKGEAGKGEASNTVTVIL
uniref:Uncharacterized protein n=1 Tax=Candidatus Kentrum sp. FW TaxID=2126338 RepID=A0A450TD83_9GAMM|nr:MAG: hypothetical protein BECKFW1821C_GA0114237_100666 [Candidatus Kentron sp. FW]